MQWIHKVNPEWLDARRAYLTASDIMKLLPVTPTGRPRVGPIQDVQMKVWAKKQCGITDEDITSTGVMARGHLLEPYAIHVLNASGSAVADTHHWDDCLVFSVDGIACSPDGLDIEQPKDCPVELPSSKVKALMVTEIKCYSPEAHYEMGMALNPGMLLERWQLATAMYVMPTIEKGVLAFFNPNAKQPLFTHEYTRTDLAGELAIIQQIGEAYYKMCNTFMAAAQTLCSSVVATTCPTEDAIKREILEAQMADSSCLTP
jgi:hypothetical protein